MSDAQHQLAATNRNGWNAVSKLSAIADDMESFLIQQTGRLEAQLAIVEDASAAQAGLERLVEEFEHQREEWELQRQAEQSRLQQEGAALGEAWDRLEQEQRQLFAERERIRHGKPNASSQAQIPAAGTANAHTDNAAAASEQPVNDQPKTETNWWQLEQLRLEIQKHAMVGK